MEFFSNREIAIGAWLLVAILWCLGKEGLRKSFRPVLSCFLNKYILLFTSLLVIYIFLMVYGLYEFGVWEPQNLKNTVLWTLTSAMVTLFRCRDAQDNPYYFSTAIKDNLKLVLFFEFVVTFYSYSLVVELITFPIIFTLALVHAFSQTDEKYASVVRLFDRIFGIYVLFVIGFTITNLASEPSGFFSVETLREFILPPLMSILLLPFMYFVVLFMEYEQVFLRVRHSISDGIYGYSKLLILLNFRGDRLSLSRWQKVCQSKNIDTIGDLISSFKLMKKIKTDEKRQREVDVAEGWSPYEAREYLASVGIRAKDYNPSYEDLWFSSSEYFCLEEGTPVLSNNIVYYIDGVEGIAKQLKLVLNVNNPEVGLDGQCRFAEFAEELYSKAIGGSIPDNINTAILEGRDFKVAFQNKDLIVKRVDWLGGIKDDYELKFVIRMAEFNMGYP